MPLSSLKRLMLGAAVAAATVVSMSAQAGYHGLVIFGDSLSDSGNNYTGWSDAAYDDLIRQAGATADNARRFSLLAQAEARLLASAPMIPVYHYTHVFAIHPAVRGWSPSLLDHHPYKHVWLEN